MPQFKVSLEQQHLDKINGPPVDEIIYNEADLLDYLRQAHQKGSLIYCRKHLELDPMTGEILNDPIKNIVNIKHLIDENKQQNP